MLICFSITSSTKQTSLHTDSMKVQLKPSCLFLKSWHWAQTVGMFLSMQQCTPPTPHPASAPPPPTRHSLQALKRALSTWHLPRWVIPSFWSWSNISRGTEDEGNKELPLCHISSTTFHITSLYNKTHISIPLANRCRWSGSRSKTSGSTVQIR